VFNDEDGQVFETFHLPAGFYVLSGQATFVDFDRDFHVDLQLEVNGTQFATARGDGRQEADPCFISVSQSCVGGITLPVHVGLALAGGGTITLQADTSEAGVLIGWSSLTAEQFTTIN